MKLILKFVLMPSCVVFLSQLSWGQFTDSYASTDEEQYVEALNKLIDKDKHDDNFARDAAYLARTFSRTDKLNIPPNVVIEHIRLAQSSRSRFYAFIPTRAYQDYLLALRIRYERTAHPNWRRVLHEKLNPLTKDTTDIDRAANIVFQWIREEIRLEDEGNTYPIGVKGDLDPLTTLRGKAGTEIDLTILGVAALRSIGIAARIVYAPAIANEKGGKMWLEYRAKENWIPWVPSNPTDADHMAWLQKRFGKDFAVIASNVRNPQNITPRYCFTFPIWYCPEPLTSSFNINLCVLGSDRLLPMSGKDLMNDLPENLDYGLGIHPYLITFGSKYTVVGYKLINVTQPSVKPAWYTFSFKQKKQFLEFSEHRPDYFEWTNNFFRKYGENW